MKRRRSLLLMIPAVLLLCFATTANAQFNVLHNFGTQACDPTFPVYPGVVAQGHDGNLYTTSDRGLCGFGNAFKVTPGGTLTVLHEFETVDAVGLGPSGGLTLATDGNFYGTAPGCGFANCPGAMADCSR